MSTTSYRVQVFFHGQFIATHTIEAASALAAIDLIEARYGEPPKVEYKTIFHEDGRKEHILTVTDWHGFSFIARRLKP